MILLDLPGVLAVAARIQECDGKAIVDLADLDAVRDAVAESAEAEVDDLAGAAARLLASLARRRPFPWHNRRIAVAAMLALLALNGHDLAVEPAADLNPLLDDVVDRDLPVAALAERLRPRIHAIDDLGRPSGSDPAPDPTAVREESPMFERFTDRARRATVLAQEEARELGHDYIGTEHILLGLIHEGDGVAAKAMASLGISLPAVRSQVEEIIGRGAERPRTHHIPFTPRAKKVLELALREALQLGHNYIGTEHILLGLVREGEGVAAQALVKLGADLDKVRATVRRLLSEGSPGAAGAGGPMAGRRALVQQQLDAVFDENDHLRAEVDRLRGLLRRHDVDPDQAA